MLLLGIESSCDETGVALYDTSRGLLSHALFSQIALHAKYGGVVPELASRDHIKKISPLIHEAVSKAGVSLQEIDAIAYTKGPGLAGALLVGATVASSLASALGVPVIGVHHMEGHLLSPLLSKEPPSFPFIAMLVSGGHTQIFDVAGVGQYRLLGDTLDDAAGEAFDKAAQLLGLEYPGGPALSKLARGATAAEGNKIRLPRPMLDSPDLNFSFSGLKTAVATMVHRAEREGVLNDALRAAIANEFENAAVDVLAAKCLKALKRSGCGRLVVAGGVGANEKLRARLRRETVALGAKVYFPEMEYCTDNGAMIALVGALRIAQAKRDYAFTVSPRWRLEEVGIER
jgi:N6-L-threonylcarbamoyladenine synthase